MKIMISHRHCVTIHSAFDSLSELYAIVLQRNEQGAKVMRQKATSLAGGCIWDLILREVLRVSDGIGTSRKSDGDLLYRFSRVPIALSL